GTAIGMGLATAVNRTKDSPSKSKVIILLTDGVNNTGYIKPITAAEIAREFGIKVYTIGVGTIGDALTPVSRRSDGRYIFGLARVEIDEPLMQQIAEMTGGRYFRATDAESLQQVYDQIDKLEKTKVEVTTIKRYSEEFYYFAGIALFLLILEFIFRYTIFRTIP
ncbi:MAG TPA: VWA domain-containing protein, partial [Saprospiraceae bacterium]|nr:VWA domain-containing protein [Saprospiraceae bacterium]